jgi:hypothetical protein
MNTAKYIPNTAILSRYFLVVMRERIKTDSVVDENI